MLIESDRRNQMIEGRAFGANSLSRGQHKRTMRETEVPIAIPVYAYLDTFARTVCV